MAQSDVGINRKIIMYHPLRLKKKVNEKLTYVHSKTGVFVPEQLGRMILAFENKLRSVQLF